MTVYIARLVICQLTGLLEHLMQRNTHTTISKYITIFLNNSHFILHLNQQGSCYVKVYIMSYNTTLHDFRLTFVNSELHFINT